MDLTPSERAELAQLRSEKRQRQETLLASVAIAQEARRVLRPCPACQRPSTARERRKPCECGYRWPMRDR